MSDRSLSAISTVTARYVLDSRGRPTVEVDVKLASGASGRASVPSGASTGRHEAHELRDGDPGFYAGRGVGRAVMNVSGEIAERLHGLDACEQSNVDAAMSALDGTAEFGRLGANAVLGVSLAVCRAAASHKHQPLHVRLGELVPGARAQMPMPMVNIFSGGAHAGRSMDVQDFLAVPVGATSYPEALDMAGRVRRAADEVMASAGLTTLLAAEGGLSPAFRSADQAFELMLRSIEAAGLRPGADVSIAVDVAASELKRGDRYVLEGEGKTFTSGEMTDFLQAWTRKYPVVSVEDGLDQDDWEHWSALTAALRTIQVVGDDLFATNEGRICEGIGRSVANAVLIKLNQNGTLTGTLAAMATARRAGYATVVSARSGETEDTFIADLAVATGAGQIKIGSLRSSERLAKYNQLLRIDPEIGDFAGTRAMAPFVPSTT